MILKDRECREALVQYAQLNGIGVPTYNRLRTGFNRLVKEINDSNLRSEFDIHVTDDSVAMIYISENKRNDMWITVDTNAHDVIIYNVFDDVTEGKWQCYSPNDAVDLIIHYGIARDAMESGF